MYCAAGFSKRGRSVANTGSSAFSSVLMLSCVRSPSQESTCSARESGGFMAAHQITWLPASWHADDAAAQRRGHASAAPDGAPRLGAMRRCADCTPMCAQTVQLRALALSSKTTGPPTWRNTRTSRCCEVPGASDNGADTSQRRCCPCSAIATSVPHEALRHNERGRATQQAE